MTLNEMKERFIEGYGEGDTQIDVAMAADLDFLIQQAIKEAIKEHDEMIRLKAD
jgi:hypothetical protein